MSHHRRRRRRSYEGAIGSTAPFVTDREVGPELVGNHRFWESSARFELYPRYSTVRPKAQISGRRIHPYNCRYRPRLLINWITGASGLREYSYRGIRGSARP